MPRTNRVVGDKSIQRPRLAILTAIAQSISERPPVVANRICAHQRRDTRSLTRSSVSPPSSELRCSSDVARTTSPYALLQMTGFVRRKGQLCGTPRPNSRSCSSSWIAARHEPSGTCAPPSSFQSMVYRPPNSPNMVSRTICSWSSRPRLPAASRACHHVPTVADAVRAAQCEPHRFHPESGGDDRARHRDDH